MAVGAGREFSDAHLCLQAILGLATESLSDTGWDVSLDVPGDQKVELVEGLLISLSTGMLLLSLPCTLSGDNRALRTALYFGRSSLTFTCLLVDLGLDGASAFVVVSQLSVPSFGRLLVLLLGVAVPICDSTDLFMVWISVSREFGPSCGFLVPAFIPSSSDWRHGVLFMTWATVLEGIDTSCVLLQPVASLFGGKSLPGRCSALLFLELLFPAASGYLRFLQFSVAFSPTWFCGP